MRTKIINFVVGDAASVDVPTGKISSTQQINTIFDIAAMQYGTLAGDD